uniref:Septin-like protein n=1 Tax=Suberites domuncula TaxID=55567 RepID=Q8T310_SUBDO|nr:Septin-like protein [Suberites domuncula]
MRTDASQLGFANLPFLAHRKSVKKGFEFTLMVVGESGLGKSTLVQSLFFTNFFGNKNSLPAIERINQTVSIDATTVDIEEKGVKLRLTVVDTPGFGDAVNNTVCWQPVIDYVNEKYEQYLRDESGLNRRNIEDHRVHCCLYFINPCGHGLKPLDIEFMKQLHHLVNIIPVTIKCPMWWVQQCQEEWMPLGCRKRESSKRCVGKWPSFKCSCSSHVVQTPSRNNTMPYFLYFSLLYYVQYIKKASGFDCITFGIFSTYW